jgi:hypothetical protein
MTAPVTQEAALMTRDEEPAEAMSADGLTVPRRKVVLSCLAIASLATAVIHFAVTGEHFQEYWLFGVFMLVVAWAQLLWAAAAIARPSRPLLWSGVALNCGVIAIYIMTRTLGDVIGPTPQEAEPFGFGDGFCTVLEAAVVAGCAWLLICKMDRRVRRQSLLTTSVTAGTVTAALLSVALVAGGPEMVMSVTGTAVAGTAPAMHMPRSAALSIRLATESPAGDITMPNPDMQMAAGMRMASSAPCTATPSAAQQQAAVRLVNTSWTQARRYQSLAVAKAAGYRPITPTGAPVVHYFSRSAYIATLLGGTVLDTAEPQSLVYANTPKGAVLVAAMYITTRHGATPQPGGCLTRWHVHTNLCLRGGLGVVGEVGVGQAGCPAGSTNRVTPPMMHIWFVPIPGGPTAVDATNAQVVRAAEQVASPRNGTA